MSGQTSTIPSVVMVSTPDDGSCGIGTYTGNLRRAFDRAVDITQVTLDTGANDAGHFLRVALQAGTRDADVIHVQYEYGLFGPRSIHSWLFFPLLWLLTTLRGIPLIITVHESWTRETISDYMPRIKWVYVRAINHLLVMVADELVFLSDAVKRAFTETVSVRSSQMIPHGVILDQEFDGSKRDAKNELGIDPEATLVVEPGYVSEQKGCDRFISLASRFPEVEFLLAGGSLSPRDDSFVESLRDRASENVTITGRLPHRQFHAAFVAADLIVLPYRKDGQSGVINWCATYEVPTVGSDCAYFYSLATTYGCLDLVEATDADALAAGVSRLLADKSRREYLKRAMSRYKAINHFEAVADRHIRLYQNLLGGARGAQP
jgi:glycosyltransferase involved in cell wall biosynthesis